MGASERQEVELTADLLEYAKAVTITECKKRCPRNVKYVDVVQEVWLNLISKPPKYDPAQGTTIHTFLYTVVQRLVLKYIARECRQRKRFTQDGEDAPEAPAPESNIRAGTKAARASMIGLSDAEATDDATPLGAAPERRAAELRTKGLTTDDILLFIDDLGSRALCLMVIECKGNLRETARRLNIAEGTVRYRLKMLAPKLLAAGFNPFAHNEEFI